MSRLKNSKYKPIKLMLIDKGISQESLAQFLNITPQCLNAKLNGKQKLYIEEAEKIIEILDISNPVEIFFKSGLRGTQKF